jgi:hypothetical protein
MRAARALVSDHLVSTHADKYLAFYEETRSTIIRRRNGPSTSGLTTAEGILAGVIAGE